MLIQIRSPFLLLFFMLLFGPSTIISAQTAEKSSAISVSNPETLIEQGVEFQETKRTFSEPKFSRLRKRYNTIDGIVMVGITNEDGDVLLKGPDSWGPPGGPVKPTEDWAAAARRMIEEQADVSIRLDAPVLVERMKFIKEGSEQTQFHAYILHFEASLAHKDVDFCDHPVFRWFSEVPKQAHPNHVDHIKLYLE